MKQFSITLQKDAVEKHICKLIDDLSKSKLSGEDEMIFNLLQLGEVIPLNAVETKDKPFLVQLIEAKIETFFDYSIQDSWIIGIIAQVSKSAGFCIVYLAYLQYLCKINKIKEITMKQFLDWFKDGFFTKQQLEYVWDEQKIERKSFEFSDNLLDYHSAYESIRFDVNIL